MGALRLNVFFHHFTKCHLDTGAHGRHGDAEGLSLPGERRRLMDRSFGFHLAGGTPTQVTSRGTEGSHGRSLTQSWTEESPNSSTLSGQTCPRPLCHLAQRGGSSRHTVTCFSHPCISSVLVTQALFLCTVKTPKSEQNVSIGTLCNTFF